MELFLNSWNRYESMGQPIFVSLEEPHWFVPNPAGDSILQRLSDSTCAGPEGEAFLARIPRIRKASYLGRDRQVELGPVRELWFHVTNRCNLTCAHCLFTCSPKDDTELSAGSVSAIVEESYETGCRLFALTGGEPLVHAEIDAIVDGILSRRDTHLVMLTNGLKLLAFLDRNTPDPERFHVQISLDGLGDTHDLLRGQGAFTRLCRTLHGLRERAVPFTLSMCVTRDNVAQMMDVIDFAADRGAGNVHFMWYFVEGRGTPEKFPPLDDIFDNLTRATDLAERRGVGIDNVEALKSQIFAPAGTIHDGSSGGWESLAVGPDGRLYPSAALVGRPELATDMPDGLLEARLESPILQRIRGTSVAQIQSPWRFILGGGDMDHSYVHKGSFMGDDPYEPLHQRLALWLIAREARKHPRPVKPGIVLQMGETLRSCGAHGNVAFLHSNCLLATAQQDSLTSIKEFYTQAAGDTKEGILNPVCYAPDLIAHVPEAFRFRGYGCGSPVLDADVRPTERVVDLGCGAGVECFIASRLVGPDGSVIGVDMLDSMLHLARKAQPQVAANLGYDNLDFRGGYLESLPLQDESADVVVSNCVMNLSTDKRRAFSEILRVLRPGGRLVISDVVCESEPDAAIRNDEMLLGECIAGALNIAHLCALLEELGFTGVRLLKRFPYRQVAGHPFFSLTFSAQKPLNEDSVDVMYRGPLPYLLLASGTLLPKGATVAVTRQEADLLGDQVFQLGSDGTTLNVEAENTCACYRPPEKSRAPASDATAALKQGTGCMVCGAPLTYFRGDQERSCAYCGLSFRASGQCENGHFVCDACHGADAVEVIRHICLSSTEKDMLKLFVQIRQHPAVPVHGPEYHAMIPGIILTAYRNLGGEVSEKLIETAISRGRGIAGGFCGFMGVCGAAVGVGIAYSLLLDANPIKARERKQVQGVTQAVLAEIARFKAARCCQRDGWIALNKAAELSAKLLPVALSVNHVLRCMQSSQNAECLGPGCPLHPGGRSLRAL